MYIQYSTAGIILKYIHYLFYTESSYDDLEASPIILGIIITILVLLLCIIIKIYFNSHIMNGDVMNNAKQSGSLLNKQDSALKVCVFIHQLLYFE